MKVPYRDIAKALGSRKTAVRTSVHRLRQRFGKLLRQEIAKMTEGTELERIGLPLPESAPSDQREMLWFPPFDEAGGVVLQRLAQTGSPRFCASSIFCVIQ